MEIQSGKVRVIPLRSRKGETHYVFCSEEDYEFLNQFPWHFNHGYARNKRLGCMHRIIAEKMGLDLSKEIDHRDRNKLNNLRSNLRIATHQENMRNHSIRSDNLSSYPGVSLRRTTNKWMVRINILGKRKHLGHFKTFEEAKAARIEAEMKYYGEFRPIYTIFKFR